MYKLTVTRDAYGESGIYNISCDIVNYVIWEALKLREKLKLIVEIIMSKMLSYGFQRVRFMSFSFSYINVILI